jgi:hypothetical protein
LQMAQRLLNRHARNLIEPCVLGLFLHAVSMEELAL